MKNKRNILILLSFILVAASVTLLYVNAPFSVMEAQKVNDAAAVKAPGTTGPDIPAKAVGRRLWKKFITVEITGAPVCFGNRIVFASKAGYIYCANPENGDMVWKTLIHAPILKALSIDTDGRIFAAASSKKLYCLNMNGEIQWSTALDGVPRTTPIMSKDFVYLGTEEGWVYAVNKSTHKTAWKTDIQLPIFSSAVFNHSQNQILVPTKDYHLVAVDTDGGIAWKYKTTGVIYSSPAITKTGDIYLTSMDHHIYKLSPRGALLWKFKCSRWIIASPVIDEKGNVYFGSYDRHFYCLDSHGNLLWKHKGKAGFNAVPVIDSLGNIYSGDSAGAVHAFNSEGKVLWTHKTADIVNTGLSIYSPGKILIAGSLDGFIYAFKINGELSKTAIWPKYLGNQRNSGYVE